MNSSYWIKCKYTLFFPISKKMFDFDINVDLNLELKP